MDNLTIGFILIGVLFLLVLLGMRIGIALLLIAFFGVWLIRDNFDLAMRLMSISAYNGVSSYLFATIPLFVLMGYLVSVSNVGKDTFDVAEVGLRNILGGLGVATVAANTVFAAVTGVSIASAAVFTKVAVPEMVRHGYRSSFSCGAVAGSSVLGMLIPPSLLLIIYGVLAEQSIGKMFLAGLVPGILLAGGFIIMIMSLARFAPRMVFNDAAAHAKASASKDVTLAGSAPDMTGFEMFRKLVPIAVLVTCILGGLYSGFFTPTEAGGVGAFAAFVIALARHSLTWSVIWDVLMKSGTISVGILLLLVAANFYSQMLAVAGVPSAIGDLVSQSGFGTYGFLLVYVLLLLLLGMILDSTSILLIVVPIGAPIAQSLGLDLIHFGIITVIAVEVGLLTPPFGISIFTVHATLNDGTTTLESIFAGTLPFVVVMLISLVIITAFPWLLIY